jgi:tannase/feruloyl esterase
VIRALEAGPVPLEKMKIIAERVYAKCDGFDGLVDGLIDDPRRCDFDPAKELPACANDVDGKDCFTAAQIRALNAIYRGAESGGKRVFWGQPVGAEIGAPAQSIWANWIISPSPTGRTISYNFAESFFRFLAFPKPDPNYDFKSFNIETDTPKLQAISEILDAKNPDLTHFKTRGGKIVMYFGWADTALNPLMGVDYYEKVSARFGPSTTDFFRLFMVPGMAHCRGGVGTDQCDFLTALIEWVEKGIAPKQIGASQSRDGKVIRTRPLCPYPQVAKYKGTGNPDDAQSFVCENQEKRP